MGAGSLSLGETMRATAILTEEHRVIERGLGALERAAERLDRGDEVPRTHLEGILRFIQGFADGCHHRKEEDVLFPYLRGKGLPPGEGPVEILLREHDAARGFMGAMREALAGAHRAAFVGPARDYVALLRDHIAKEDEVLLPMVEARMERGDDASLHEAFEAVEAELGGHEAYLALLTDLERTL